MKKLAFNLTLVCLAAMMFAFISDLSKDLAGTWNYMVKDAPEGYQEGQIEFKEKDGKLEGKMITDNGTFPMEKLSMSNDTINYELDINSTVVQAVLVKVKDSLSGKIITDNGDLVITAKKRVESGH